MSHPYTLASLGADEPCFIARTPGVVDIERLFPSPSSSGKGHIGIEGGVSVIAGPGMGKTSLLTNLARHLDRDRQMATVLVEPPLIAAYPDQEGFYAFMGDLVRQIRAGLAASRRLQSRTFAPVAQTLAAEPVWDAESAQSGMTPRGFSSWITDLGLAATHTPGVCLLFDDIDHVATAAWKSAFVAGLRFTFQTSTGITPVYALWTLFANESISGSSYFRNVTRPVFLEPLCTQSSVPGRSTHSERRALVDLGLPALPTLTAERLFALIGGHPQLLHQSLSDVCVAVPNETDIARMTPGDLDDLFKSGADEAQRRLASDLLARTPALGPALREIARDPQGSWPLAKGLLATGFVDRNHDGRPFLPIRIAEIL